MATEGFDVRISLQRLLTVLLLTIVPLSILGLYLTTQADKALEQAVGSHFKMIADSKADEISLFINAVVTAMGAMAAAPGVTEEALAADQTYRGARMSAVESRIQARQKEWNTEQGAAVAQKILSNRAARLLNRYREIDARLLRITVTDERGAVIAATHKPTAYYYGADEQWLAINADGKGTVQVAPVRYDETTKTAYIGIGVPVLEEASGRFLGAVQSLVDISPVAALLNRGLTGAGPRGSLLRGDGTIIFGPEVSLSMNLKAAEHAALDDALGNAKAREIGYVVADLPGGGRNLVGFADTGLKRDYRNLDWVVLVSQDAGEAMAAIRGISRFALLMVILGLLMVVLFSVYFYLHRRQQTTDIAGS